MMQYKWSRPRVAEYATCMQQAPRQLRVHKHYSPAADRRLHRLVHTKMDTGSAWASPRTRALVVVAAAAAAAGAMGHPFRPVALLFHLIRLAVATLVAAVGLPLLLSTAVGARLLAGAAGRALGARVEVDRVCCVWWQPLRVEGMRVYMPTTRSSVVSSSGDDTSEGPPSQPQQEPDQQLGATAQPVGAAGADAAASSVPDQSPEQQQQQHSGFEVLSVERISTAEPLSYLASGRPLTLTLARPCLTLTWDPATGAPRLPGALQLSSLPAVTLEPPHSSHPHLPQQQILRDLMRGQNSGAGAEGTGRSSKKARSKGTSTTTPSSSSSSSSQVLKRLQQADGVVGLSAELLLPTAQVYVAEGRLACPSELSAALGEYVHLSAAAGPGPVGELAEQLDREPPHTTTTTSSSASASGVGGGVWPSSTKWPFLMQVAGSHLQGSVAGWWLGGTRLALAEPAAATWTATPQLFRLTMGLVNPFMRNVAAMPQHTTFATRLTPLPAQPDSSSSKGAAMLCQLDPMQMQVGASPLLNQLVTLLRLSPGTANSQVTPPAAAPVVADSTPPAPEQQQQQQGGGRLGLLRRILPSSSSSSPGAQGDGGAWGAAAWVGPCEVVVLEGGRMELRRLDMQLSIARCRRPPAVVTLALWGGADPVANTLSLKLGLTAPTLASLGIHGLPPDYVLPLRLTGNCDAPSLEWGDAMRRLAVLSAMQASARGAAGAAATAAGAAGGGQAPGVVVGESEGGAAAAGRGPGGGVLGLLGKVLGGLNTAAEAQLEEVPPPIVSVLPWQASQ